MTVTRTTLIARFPEFTDADSDFVTACIADATLLVNATHFGTKADMAITHLAAHLIAINPLGEMARLDKRGEKTTYLLSYERIKRSVSTGCRAI